MGSSFTKFIALYLFLFSVSLFSTSITEAQGGEDSIPMLPLGRLVAPESVAGDQFGHVSAIDGDFAVVGAPGRDNGATLNVGAAYVFKRSSSEPNNGGWTYLWKLSPTAAVSGASFGVSVALKGRTIAVGAPGGPTSGPRERVYVYNIPDPEPANPPAPTIIEKPCAGEMGEQCCWPNFQPNVSGCCSQSGDISHYDFGREVALDLDATGTNALLAVSDPSARFRTFTLNPNCNNVIWRSRGSVAYLYSRLSPGGSWTRLSQTFSILNIDGSFSGTNSGFGRSLAVKNLWNGSNYANSLLAVGASSYDPPRGAYALIRFNQQESLKISGPLTGPAFGSGGIALNQNTSAVLIGTPENKVYSYYWYTLPGGTSATWNLAEVIQNPLTPPGSPQYLFGYKPNIDWNLATLGSPQFPSPGSSLVYAYEITSQNPFTVELMNKRQILPPESEPLYSSTDNFGISNSSSMGRQLVCSLGSVGSGYCYVYNCAGDTDGGGYIDFIDLNVVLSNFGVSCIACPADVNRDHVVDFLDLNVVLSSFGYRCAPELP